MNPVSENRDHKRKEPAMAFGSIIQIKDGELNIELAPFSREDSLEFIKPGLQQSSVTKYLGITGATVQDDQLEWYDRIRKDDSRIIWGIWLIEGGKRKLIGNSVLFDIKRKHIHRATSGSLITSKEYWGKGIASACHKARTWYAFRHLGFHCIGSEVLQGNIASRKALEKSGYIFTHTYRNEKFVDGKLRHIDRLECINPIEALWSQWWGEDKPPKEFVEARGKTQDIFTWAIEHVVLP